MLRPDGTPDYQAAALVLESIGRHLQSKAADLNAGGICYIMASYVKCRCVMLGKGGVLFGFIGWPCNGCVTLALYCSIAPAGLVFVAPTLGWASMARL
jgi:hypothetical protein